MEWLLAKPRSLSNLLAFLDLNGSISFITYKPSLGNLDFLYLKLVLKSRTLSTIEVSRHFSHQQKVNVCLIYHFKELTLKIVATPGNKRRKTVTIFMHQFMTTIILEYFSYSFLKWMKKYYLIVIPRC